AFPRASSARYLVPIGAPRPAAAGVAGYGRLQRPRQRLARRAAALAVLTGRGHLPGAHVVSAPGDATALRPHLEDVLGVQGLHLGVAVRSINPHHKPMVRVLRSDGSTVAFCKLARRPAAKARLTREAEALRALADGSRPRLRVPGLLHVGEWRDRALLVTS